MVARSVAVSALPAVFAPQPTQLAAAHLGAGIRYANTPWASSISEAQGPPRRCPRDWHETAPTAPRPPHLQRRERQAEPNVRRPATGAQHHHKSRQLTADYKREERPQLAKIGHTASAFLSIVKHDRGYRSLSLLIIVSAPSREANAKSNVRPH